MITRDRLLDLLSYDKNTGVFTWVKSRGRLAKAGTKAGKVENNGYVRIKIDGKLYSAHRLAHLYVYGHFPSGDLDHINREKCDNRLENLRLCNRSENRQNTKISRNNKSGHKGVSWNKEARKWRAYLKFEGKQYYLGGFKERNDAIQAWIKAASVLHPFSPFILNSTCIDRLTERGAGGFGSSGK